MKFLVHAAPRRDQIPPAPVIDACLAWIQNQLANKTMDCCYGFITGGGISVSNADSADAMLRQLMSYPGFPFVEFKVEALCSITTALEEVKAMSERAARASA
jgi:hypothetical protein